MGSWLIQIGEDFEGVWTWLLTVPALTNTAKDWGPCISAFWGTFFQTPSPQTYSNCSTFIWGLWWVIREPENRKADRHDSGAQFITKTTPCWQGHLISNPGNSTGLKLGLAKCPLFLGNRWYRLSQINKYLQGFLWQHSPWRGTLNL